MRKRVSRSGDTETRGGETRRRGDSQCSASPLSASPLSPLLLPASPRLPLPASILLALALACSGLPQGTANRLRSAQRSRATESVNGTAVFAEMFEAEGHRVSSWSSLSPRLDQADCIVWFPDDFQPPVRRLSIGSSTWLQARPQRTLIYVGRDFDAAPWYWRKMESTAPASQRAGDRRTSAAERGFQSARQPKSRSGLPLVSRPLRRAGRPAHNVTGDLEWLQNIDPSQMDVELNSQMSARLYMERVAGVRRGPDFGKLDIGQEPTAAWLPTVRSCSMRRW